MGKKFNKVAVIVFFPITFIFKLIDRIITNNFLKKLDINKIDSLDGLAFEEFLYYSFKSLGIKVTRTKSSRDYGADLVLKIKKQTIVIQSKLYFNHSVGNSAIQEIASARTYYNADSGVVITNSYFTKSACNLATSTQVRLVDRNMLCEFLSSNKSRKKKIINEW